MEMDGEIPKFLFFITQNSHIPFTPPDSLVQDWHTLNVPVGTTDQESEFITRPSPEKYLESECYEIRLMTRFITSFKNKNAVFILIGDHQPPMLTTENDGFETPVHIISGDPAFIAGFKEYGFVEGLQSDSVQKIRHEALYSLLLRELVRNYGQDTLHLPRYFPEGLNVIKP